MWRAKFPHILLYGIPLVSFYSSSTLAQTLPDHTLGSESSTVTRDVNAQDTPVDLIEGGATRGNNLFHSFSEFNVDDGAAVYFASPDGIANILSRVTGNNPSEIFGTLGVDGGANLFLLNPNGIVFGENAALDLNGSFLATTADSYIFENDFAYSANNPNSPPLLTINLPMGLQFGSKAEAIEVRGTGSNISFDPETFEQTWDARSKGLEVHSGNTLALIGGEINLKGGNITSLQGRIELASIAAKGNVSLISTDNGFSLDGRENDNFKDINLTQSASIDTSGNGSGNLQLQGKNISLLDGSAIFTRTLGDDNGREVKINATDSVNIIGANAESLFSGIYDEVAAGATGNAGNLLIAAKNIELSEGNIHTDTFGTGKSGNLSIETNSLRVKDGAVISTVSYGAGDSGILAIAANHIEILGESSDGIYASGLRTDTFATGKGGDLIIDADKLQVKDGAVISSGSYGAGDSGNVHIKATNVEVSGRSPTDYPSTILTSVTSFYSLEPSSKDGRLTGNSGNLTINAEQLLVRDGGLINSFSIGEENAGNININVKKLGMDGDFAQISTETFGDGNGGDLIVRATESIEINGSGLLPSSEVENQFGLVPNGLFTSSTPSATGNGGNLVVETGNLSLSQGGTIFANTLGEGNAGNISIRANNLEIRNVVFLPMPFKGRGAMLRL